MARVKKKAVEVQKFGGTESLGTVKEEGNFDVFKSGMTGKESVEANVTWDAQSVETQSNTNLEADEGYGNNVVIRCFTFGANPESFQKHPPTKQELFNSHYKGIEVYLWKDGLKIIPEVNPRIVVNQETGRYQIFVGATPARGQLLTHEAKTLKDIVNG